MDLRLSVLDQSPISEGMTAGDALRNTLDLASLGDELGYTRYWVAEHHGTPMLACAAPEVLIGPIAQVTSRMHIGSGGIMLPHYSPLKVAETFGMLAALAPGRIDLGLGRAAGTDPTSTYALQRDRRQAAPDDFPHQLAELLGHLNHSLPSEHPFSRLRPLHGNTDWPEPWLLGSSPQSGIWAAELGLPYAFADFIAPGGETIMSRYQAAFQPSDRPQAPRAARGLVAVWVLCADTDEEARRLASSARMAFTLFQRGELRPVPPVETALAFLAQPVIDPLAVVRRRRTIVGSPSSVVPQIRGVAREYGVDEVMIVTITFEHAARRRSYELLAEAFGLSRRGQPAVATSG
jgi:luciferase family oxidoreductase group 1